jgi:hypothetical protein
MPVPIYSPEPSRTLLNNEQRQCLPDSLMFDQIDARQMTIKTAHGIDPGQRTDFRDARAATSRFAARIAAVACSVPLFQR